ncbi:radical SAM family heme chaperone HemW, partial [candidate division KSB1 bacterium]|nr:radical SAM family heme chaperone HemW [candidate division KSB1 bacterium]NIR73424.1 radical SAM family heme chaperone HemW [candidate division KSB1 bacterium]NIS28415.1 radical SAM family heme chaperone HemW [candidate division KSB1 bacterium]NIT75295.1 radical SAM family heme chaperone HemW [candidate division KSB1 bacterium]NIU29143.1 radical SAM family heme chaperone HemW [candidate division KSB1 bacterium]
PNPEITIETNPGTVDLDKLKAYREAGVNRLSLGMQSFQPEELFALDRIHTVEDAHSCYEDARKAGFENVSVDLIFALPNQPFENWQTTLTKAVALGPEHISAYNLSFESGTPLTKTLRRGEIAPCSVDVERKMYLHSIDYLQAHGYEQYEISNFAKPNRECVHNQKYWDGSPYLGLGASSHSFMDKRRFWNVRNLREYIELLNSQTLPIEGEETLDLEQKSFERVLLGLRQRRGVDLKSFENDLGFSFFEKYVQPLSKFFSCDFSDGMFASELSDGQRKIKSRLLEIEDGFLKLTKQGLLLNDSICAAFL